MTTDGEGLPQGEGEHPLVALARRAVEYYALKRAVLEAPLSPSVEMDEQAGVFVSIKSRGELRGCIGTFEPTKGNVAEEIIHNAIAAASRDPRFLPITIDELELLSYSVDVLTLPEEVAEADLDPRRYGVIVAKGSRRGVLLPDLEGIDSVVQQVSIARSKAGILPGEAMVVLRFEVQRYR